MADRAFDGAETVFWLAPPDWSKPPEAGTVDLARVGAEAIRRRGVARVVAVTTLGRDTPWEDRAGMATCSTRGVDVLRSTGAALRGLALPAFMDNALMQVDAIRQGRMTGPIDPDRKMPHTAARDSGAAAARLLLDRSWSGQEDVPVLGPEELSYADVSEVIGREIRYEQVRFDGLAAQLIGRGANEAFVQAYIAMLRAKNEGMDAVAPRSSAIIGATSFSQWAEEELKPAVLG